MDLNFTWLLSKFEGGTLGFSIDRSAKTCKTPTRNADIDAALAYMNDFHTWAGNVCHLHPFWSRVMLLREDFAVHVPTSSP
jgi:hypothetical protein